MNTAMCSVYQSLEHLARIDTLTETETKTGTHNAHTESDRESERQIDRQRQTPLSLCLTDRQRDR